MRQLFVAPALDGPCSGGTIYNRALLQALGDPARYRHCTIESAGAALAGFAPERVWIDSLYLEHLPPLAARFDCGLLLHYLPTLLSDSEPATPAALSERERRAFAAARRALVPSSTLANCVARLFPELPIASVEPGVDVSDAPRPAREPGRAVLVGNVVENKGVQPFLAALAAQCQPGDPMSLAIVGRLDAEPHYAHACMQLVARTPALAARVEFTGALPQREVFAQLARASVCVSASRMESFGMALAEARALATPLLARDGGHVAALVLAAAGGELVRDELQLAAALLRLLRNPAEQQRRGALAQRARFTRSWADAAAEFARLAHTLP